MGRFCFFKWYFEKKGVGRAIEKKTIYWDGLIRCLEAFRKIISHLSCLDAMIKFHFLFLETDIKTTCLFARVYQGIHKISFWYFLSQERKMLIHDIATFFCVMF